MAVPDNLMVSGVHCQLKAVQCWHLGILLGVQGVRGVALCVTAAAEANKRCKQQDRLRLVG